MRSQSQQAPVAAQRRAIDAAAHQAATSPRNDRPLPTAAQREASNFQAGHIRFQGLDITVQYPRGASRSGTDSEGNAWSQKVTAHYGHIKGTIGADGDQVDVFIGPNPSSTKVFVVDQIDQKTDGYDEAKVLLGYNDQASATAGYLSNFAKGWQIGPVKALSISKLKEWLKNGDTTKPLNTALRRLEQSVAETAARTGAVDGRSDLPTQPVDRAEAAEPPAVASVSKPAGEGEPVSLPADGDGEAAPALIDDAESIASMNPERAAAVIKGIVARVAHQIETQWARSIASNEKAGIDDARASLKKWNTENPDLPIVVKPQDVARLVARMKAAPVSQQGGPEASGTA